MCELDTILQTSLNSFPKDYPRQKRGMSFNRIEYTTNLLFAIAKRVELPLDKTMQLIREKGEMPKLCNSFLKRKAIKPNTIIREISKSIMQA